VKVLILFLLALAPTACSQKSDTSQVKHQYQLTGRVVSLDPRSQTATVDAAAIPNFMEAMTMEYPVKSKEEFKSLHPGDRIRATVDVTEAGTYDLSNIQLEKAGK